jgi:hypothetical protein
MKRIQWIAVGVLMGCVLAMAVGGLSAVHAQMQGPSPAEAQAALDREKAVLDQMNTQLMQMQHDMSMTQQMQMTPTEKAMMKQITQLQNMVHMLWQANTDLTNALQQMIGAKNK